MVALTHINTAQLSLFESLKDVRHPYVFVCLAIFVSEELCEAAIPQGYSSLGSSQS